MFEIMTLYVFDQNTKSFPNHKSLQEQDIAFLCYRVICFDWMLHENEHGPRVAATRKGEIRISFCQCKSCKFRKLPNRIDADVIGERCLNMRMIKFHKYLIRILTFV